MFCSLNYSRRYIGLHLESDMVKYLCCHWIWLLKCFCSSCRQAIYRWIILCKWQTCGLFLARSQKQTAIAWCWFYFLGALWIDFFFPMDHLLGRQVFWWSSPTAQTLASSYLLKILQIFCLWAPHACLWLSESFPADNVFSLKIDDSRWLDNGTKWKSSC